MYRLSKTLNTCSNYRVPNLFTERIFKASYSSSTAKVPKSPEK